MKIPSGVLDLLHADRTRHDKASRRNLATLLTRRNDVFQHNELFADVASSHLLIYVVKALQKSIG